MASPFRRKDIAKAFLDLDLSDTDSSSSSNNAKKQTPPPRYARATPPSTNKTKQKQKTTFLTLPTEIRLRIYDLLLISRFDRSKNPSWAIKNTSQKKIMLFMNLRGPEYRTMEPAILQTCKQVYNEAVPTLYARNVFYISGPEEMISLIAQIGARNTRFVRRLHVWVPWMAEVEPWLKLLYTLAKMATGLRFLEVGWGANFEGVFRFWLGLKRGDPERGLGDNLLFVRALARIQGLERLDIEGFYAKNWVEFLKREMQSTRVEARCGQPSEVKEGVKEQEKRWARVTNEENLSNFTYYQEGTEDLIP